MSFEPPLEKYSVKIREVAWGHGEKTVRIGGENALPFHYFEGSLPNLAGLALEVVDIEPENWAPELIEQYKDVVSSRPSGQRNAWTFMERMPFASAL